MVSEGSLRREAVIIKGPFRGARVLVVPPPDATAAAAQRLVSRVRFVTMPADPLLVRSANLAVGAERCAVCIAPLTAASVFTCSCGTTSRPSGETPNTGGHRAAGCAGSPALVAARRPANGACGDPAVATTATTATTAMSPPLKVAVAHAAFDNHRSLSHVSCTV